MSSAPPAILRRVQWRLLSEDERRQAVTRPALLGGVQILVDGGKLVFLRPAPDPGLIRGLWTLLPGPMRTALWPATFAFGNALGFDTKRISWPRTIDMNDRALRHAVIGLGSASSTRLPPTRQNLEDPVAFASPSTKCTARQALGLLSQMRATL